MAGEEAPADAIGPRAGGAPGAVPQPAAPLLRATARASLGALIGGALACLLLPRGIVHRSQAAEVEVWALDQDAGRLVGLDAHGRVAEELALLPPAASAARGTKLRCDAWGDVWSVATEAEPAGWSRLSVSASRASNALARDGSSGPPDERGRPAPAARQRGDGGFSARVFPGRVVALEPLVSGALALIEGQEVPGARLVHLDRPTLHETPWLEESSSGMGFAVGRDQRFLVADAEGTLRAFERGAATVSSVLRARRRLAGRWAAFAAGPDGGWWALSSGPGRRLLRLASDLTVLQEMLPGIEGETLATWEGAPWVWVIAPEGAEVRRFDERGELVAAAGPLPLGELRSAAALPDGGLWIAGPGALLRLDPAGTPTVAQGGWERLVSLTAALAAEGGADSP